MKNFDHKQLEELLNQGKLVEARAMLEDFFKAELTPEEEGEAQVSLAALYLKVQNSLDEKYLEALNQSAGRLKELTSTQKGAEDQARIVALKSDLA